MSWEFSLPVKIYFGTDKIQELPKIIKEYGYKKGVLVCSNTLRKNGVAEEIIENCDGAIVAVFSDIRPNPTTDNVNECIKVLRENDADFAVALGGGSPMDCCKAACAIAKGDDIIESYHTSINIISCWIRSYVRKHIYNTTFTIFDNIVSNTILFKCV